MENIKHRVTNWLKYRINPFVYFRIVPENNDKYSIYIVIYEDIDTNMLILSPTIYKNLHKHRALEYENTLNNKFNQIFNNIYYLVREGKSFKKYITNIL